MMSGSGDQVHLMRSNTRREVPDVDGVVEEDGRDLEGQLGASRSIRNSNLNVSTGSTSSPRGGGGVLIKDLVLKHMDRSSSGRRFLRNSPRSRGADYDVFEANDLLSPSYRRNLGHSSYEDPYSNEGLEDNSTPEWALLMLGCLLGLASGLCVAAFNIGVHVIHDWAWAGTPSEGAAWLRVQRLADTWHRILLIPVTGGIIVGMMHGLVEILNQIFPNSLSQNQGVDLVAGMFPTVKAIQAAVTLGTGCSLGPEGPSVDIGKSCARGISLMIPNNRERRIALIAAGAAAGIASGFNAAVAGCFFAIETVLRPLRAENSPPFTTAMIILASVLSSAVSNVLLENKSAFTVPNYDLKSAAELPLYLILGMLCGVVSVVFTRLVTWFTRWFEFIKQKYSLPIVICPALGGLGAGLIALKYPGILYWGFTNVDEILHTGKSASAPGIWLLTQLAAAKVVATALCKGSGLVGGLYAPSLMIGAAVGAVFGGFAAEVINSAIPGNDAVAQPQAYALVGMAATLASVCSVPLTSVLLMFELTRDYRIILPLLGAVGLAIWVPSMANQEKETESTDKYNSEKNYSSLLNEEDTNGITPWRTVSADLLNEEDTDDLLLEDIKVIKAMSKKYVKVRGGASLQEAKRIMEEEKQNVAVVVDEEELLEGILTYGDVRRLQRTSNDKNTIDGNTALVGSVCTRGITYRDQERGILTCYADSYLAYAKELMEAKGIKQLPVVRRSRASLKERKRRVVAILHYDDITHCLREELRVRRREFQSKFELEEMIGCGH